MLVGLVIRPSTTVSPWSTIANDGMNSLVADGGIGYLRQVSADRLGPVAFWYTWVAMNSYTNTQLGNLTYVAPAARIRRAVAVVVAVQMMFAVAEQTTRAAGCWQTTPAAVL